MGHAERVVEEVQQIVWAMVDECVTEDQLTRLEDLLGESEAARDTYLRCVQLHSDLQELLGKPRPLFPFTPGGSMTAVLPSLRGAGNAFPLEGCLPAGFSNPRMPETA